MYINLYNYRVLADTIIEEVEKKGGKPFLCGTPVVSDAETMVSKFKLHNNMQLNTYIPYNKKLWQ